MTSLPNATPLRTGRFVILTHHAPDGTHWDLMLQWGEALKTWSLSRPADQYGSTIEGTPLPDHRAIYLDYEGLISEGRGEVCRWDSGHFTLLEETASRLLLKFQGEQLRGTYTLVWGY